MSMNGFSENPMDEAVQQEHDLIDPALTMGPKTPRPDPEASSGAETVEPPDGGQNTVSPDVDPGIAIPAGFDPVPVVKFDGRTELDMSAELDIGEPAAVPQADGADTVDISSLDALLPKVVWVDWNNDVPRLIEKYRSSPDNTPGTALHSLLIELQSVIAAE